MGVSCAIHTRILYGCFSITGTTTWLLSENEITLKDVGLLSEFGWRIHLSVNLPSLVQLKWLVACPASSHCLNLWWNIVHLTLRNKIKWNIYQNSFHTFSFKNCIWKGCLPMAAICLGPNVLTWTIWIHNQTTMHKPYACFLRFALLVMNIIEVYRKILNEYD